MVNIIHAISTDKLISKHASRLIRGVHYAHFIRNYWPTRAYNNLQHIDAHNRPQRNRTNRETDGHTTQTTSNFNAG